MSTGEKNIQLLVDGVFGIDATTTTTTDALDFGRSYKWSVIAKKFGCDGNPVITIEGSNNGSDWINPYFDKDTNAPIEIELNEIVNTAFDDIFPFSYFRVRTEQGTNTTGTVELTLNLHFQ